MQADRCYGFVCFFPMNSASPKFFGFGEFLAGLALMVLAWTIADARYRFRVRTAPLPLQGITFVMVAVVGVLTLLTDLWRAEQWLLPRGPLLTPGIWQALLAAAFLLTFLTWAWYAFISPPIFGKRNAERFAHVLYRVVLNGSPADLSIVGDELSSSARALIRFAPEKSPGLAGDDAQGAAQTPEVVGYANDILLLIADKRLCRAIVESCPGTVLALFSEIAATEKYGVAIGTFGKNIVGAALADKDSFLFQEAEGYDSGLIGYHKPLTQAMFANYPMVERIGTLLDPSYERSRAWDAAQWEAYCRAVLMTLRDYVDKGYHGHSFVLFRAKGNIEHAASDLYKLDGTVLAVDNDIEERLRAAVAFVRGAIEVLEKKGVPVGLARRIRGRPPGPGNFYDHLAGMIFELVFAASAVKQPVNMCWWIQHNDVWSELFSRLGDDGAAGKIVRFKARRLIYNEIADMRRLANFKGARILAYCLNVMGLTVSNQSFDRGNRPLQKAVLSWTKKNFAWLHSYNPRVAAACLVDGFSYDEGSRRIVRTYPAEGLRREAYQTYLEVDAMVVEAPEAIAPPIIQEI